MSALSRRMAATVLIACLGATSTAVAADGPRNRAQVQQVNIWRNQLQRPLNRLYTAALRCCSGSSDEGNLVRELGRLCGSAYAFGLIVIDDKHYLSDGRFKLHVDRAFEEIRRGTETVESVSKRLADPVWSKLAPFWKAYKDRYTPLAKLWTEGGGATAKLQEILVSSATTKVPTHSPVTLKVSVRYSDGTTKSVPDNGVSWLVLPDNGEVTIDSSRKFVAKVPGVYLVMAVFDELQSSPMVMRVTRPSMRVETRDLTDVLLSDRDAERVAVQSAACKLPGEAFRSLKIRVMEHSARIADVRVTFADGSTKQYWTDRAKTLAPGEHVLAHFKVARKIVKFDLRSHGADGNPSRQVVVGLQWRRKNAPPAPPAERDSARSNPPQGQ